MQETQRIESMLFNYETTYRTDYRFGEIREYPKTIYSKEKPSRYKRGEPEYRNIHTLAKWQGKMPPFSLLHKSKDILRTNPNNVQPYYEKPVDVDREQAQKTRLRLVMTPAVSMDDIDDERARNILCTDMYTSVMTRAMREAINPCNSLKAPLPGTLAPANLITLPKLQPAYVSPEWRMDSVMWERKQLQGYCDPTKEFWLSREPPKCKSCEQTTMVQGHRKMSNHKNK